MQSIIEDANEIGVRPLTKLFRALVAILLMFGPISGAQLNPAVTVVMALTRDLTPRVAVGYIAVQVAGAIAGAGRDPWSLSRQGCC